MSCQKVVKYFLNSIVKYREWNNNCVNAESSKPIYELIKNIYSSFDWSRSEITWSVVGVNDAASGLLGSREE